VSEIQRARILAAMVDVVCVGGAGEASVGRVVSRAGMSRRTFYELFDGREDCFLAAFDDAVARAAASVLPAYEGKGSWRERIRAGLLALLCFLEDEPALGRLLVVQTLGAGPRVLARRAEVLDALIAVVDEGRDEMPHVAGVPPLTSEGVVGAVFGVVHARMLDRDRDAQRSLSELVNPLMSMIVAPYLGARAARKELDRPTPVRRGAPRERRDVLKELDMRLTYRTVRVLAVIAEHPGESNRQVGARAGLHDQGQTSKLLARLERLCLIETTGPGHARGEANAWRLTSKGEEVEQITRTS
jgi:AcrR family transcriptional regulator/DNA-binding MarR family transcriptional regulator